MGSIFYPRTSAAHARTGGPTQVAFNPRASVHLGKSLGQAHLPRWLSIRGRPFSGMARTGPPLWLDLLSGGCLGAGVTRTDRPTLAGLRSGGHQQVRKGRPLGSDLRSAGLCGTCWEGLASMVGPLHARPLCVDQQRPCEPRRGTRRRAGEWLAGRIRGPGFFGGGGAQRKVTRRSRIPSCWWSPPLLAPRVSRVRWFGGLV